MFHPDWSMFFPFSALPCLSFLIFILFSLLQVQIGARAVPGERILLLDLPLVLSALKGRTVHPTLPTPVMLVLLAQIQLARREHLNA